jgi:hypothetical protein
MPEMAHSGLNLFTPLDFRLKPPSSMAFLAFWLSSGVGGNPPLACKWLRILSMLAITLASAPHHSWTLACP